MASTHRTLRWIAPLACAAALAACSGGEGGGLFGGGEGGLFASRDVPLEALTPEQIYARAELELSAFEQRFADPADGYLFAALTGALRRSAGRDMYGTGHRALARRGTARVGGCGRIHRVEAGCVLGFRMGWVMV